MSATVNVLREVMVERALQDLKWGTDFAQIPDGTGELFEGHAAIDRAACEKAFKAGRGTFRHIIQEELSEAFEESEPENLRRELVQVAAVAVKWIEAIDRRSK